MSSDAHLSDLKPSHPRRGGGPRLRVLAPGENSSRPLPHSIEAEQMVLSMCMLDGADVMAKCQQYRLKATSFYDPRHGVIFGVLEEMYRLLQPMDAATVAAQLAEKQLLEKAGGVPFLAEVSARVPTAVQSVFWITKVRDLCAQRETIRAAGELAEQVPALTGGGADLAGRLEAHQAWVSRALDFLRAGTTSMEDAARAAYQRTLDKLAGQPDRSRWLFTGLKEFDDRFGAFDANNEDWLVIVGAFQAGGKSSFMRQVLLHNLRAGKTAQVFLLETGLGKMLELMACTAAGVNAQELERLPKDHAARFRTALEEMHGYVGKTLHVCDEVIPVETLTARVDEHARRHGAADVVAVDHIHLLRSIKGFKAREPEMGFIAKELARCGKRNNRTILGLAQLNRSARSDGNNRRPQSHDIRDSGEVEQAARRIILLHVPDKDMRGTEQTPNQSQVMVEIIQAKHNNGRIGHREFWLRRDLTRFMDIGDTELSSVGTYAPPPPAPRPGGGMSKAAFRTGGHRA